LQIVSLLFLPEVIQIFKMAGSIFNQNRAFCIAPIKTEKFTEFQKFVVQKLVFIRVLPMLRDAGPTRPALNDPLMHLIHLKMQ
jgi:hypothetical protein